MARVRAFAEPAAGAPAAPVTPIAAVAEPVQSWPFPVEGEEEEPAPAPVVEPPKPAPAAKVEPPKAAPAPTKAAPAAKPPKPLAADDPVFTLVTEDMLNAVEAFAGAEPKRRIAALEEVEMRIRVIRAVLGAPA